MEDKFIKAAMPPANGNLKRVFYQLDEYKEKCGESNFNDVIKRWEDLGFAAEVEDEKAKIRLSIAFEQMALYMLYSCDSKSYDNWLETAIFPAIRRLIVSEDLGDVYSTRKIVDAIYDVNVGKLYDKLQFNYSSYLAMDIEAEFTVMLTDAFKKILTGENNTDELYDLLDKEVENRIKNI